MEKFQIKEFAERLKKIAKDDFGGVGKLANAIMLSQSHLSKYMGGKVEPGISFAYKLAKLNVDINKLLTGEGAVDKEAEERLEKKLEKLEMRITELEASNYRLSERNEQLEKKIIEKDIYIKELEENNEKLRVQYGRVAEANVQYKHKKIR